MNEDEINKRVAVKLHSALKDHDESHDAALWDLGFSPLISEFDIGPLASSPKVDVVLISAVEQDAGALLAVTSRPESKPISGFAWSARNKLWFRYIKASPAAPLFSAKLQNDNHGGHVSILCWYPEAPIWIRQCRLN